MRTITFGVRRTTAIKESPRTVTFVESLRKVVVKDVLRSVSFTVPQRRLLINRGEDRTIAFVRPVRSITLVQGRAGRDGRDGAGSETFGPFVAGEAITSSSLVHVSEIDGKAYLADYEAERPATGFTISGFAEGASISLYRSGLLYGLSGIVPGKSYWLGSLGQVRDSIPDHGTTQRCGDGVSSTTMIVSVSEDVVWE